jgi:hypothetical protein
MQTLKDKEKIGSTVQDQAAPCVNVSGTDGAIDTPLTQRCSAVVHDKMGFELEDTRRQLIALRSKLGAFTPAGHRCSNLVEMIQEYEQGEATSRRHLAKSISRQMAELAALTHNAEERG